MQPENYYANKQRRSYWACFLIGVGITAAVDEIVFHQLLQWHHFFDHSTPAVGLFSDGLLHAAELLAIVAGLFLMADLGRNKAFVPRWGWAGFFLGAGTFQLFDGIIDHKVLRVHQVRYGVDLFYYDLFWNLAGLALVLIGALLYYRARSIDTLARSDNL